MFGDGIAQLLHDWVDEAWELMVIVHEISVVGTGGQL